MAKNEDGEFELILGNRQLLSVFFIVVILLGVFFTMGYIVGRNSATTVAGVVTNPDADSKAPVVDPPAKAESAPPVAPPPTETASQPPTSAAPQAEPEPAKPEREKLPPFKAEPARSTTGNHPAAGQTYLQLAATSQHEADIMVDVLRKKSF